MRSGVCTVQQALTAEAASLVKQALGLARRRGHAQVTPLHVASAMLASPAGLLRQACLQSHSHPLQFRALELCFNVALNRLPASTSSPLLGGGGLLSSHHHHSQYPSLSNALVAAFKRAQAHQRRGSIENQQQPILALKIELEHLIISILDDPSVSRVMREAGFSSTQVKTKVEQSVSMEICKETKPQVVVVPPNNNVLSYPNQVRFGLLTSSLIKSPVDQIKNEDVTNVLNTILNKRRNTVIVRESAAIAESVAKWVMEKFEEGQVSGDLRHAQFISLPLYSLRNLGKNEVETKLLELKCLVKNYVVGRGVVLYLGDLKWISEFWSSYGGGSGSAEKRRSYYYCPVEHIIMELKKLVCGIRESSEAGKLILMGIASFQTYMKCKTGHPSLETIWELYPLTIAVDSLSLSLNLDSDSQPHFRTKESEDAITGWPLAESGVNKNHLSEAQSTTIVSSSTSSLPSWLQNYKKEESKTSQATAHDKDICSRLSWPVIFESKKSPKEHQFWISETPTDEEEEGYIGNNIPKPDLLSNPNSSPNSASSSEAIEEDINGLNQFNVVNAENLNILTNALEKKVAPWQKETVPEIATAILECRSGKKKNNNKDKQIRENDVVKEETWLFFLGDDREAKLKVARELARLIFGTQSSFVSLSLSNFADSNDNKKKRKRLDESSGYVERLGEALNENPHRVFFIEDIEQVDYCSLKGIKEAIQRGRVKVSDGETVPIKDAIIIFSSPESFSSSVCSQPRKRTEYTKEYLEMEKTSSSTVSLDLNIAINDYHQDSSSGGDDVGILECVDKQIIFRVQEQ